MLSNYIKPRTIKGICFHMGGGQCQKYMYSHYFGGGSLKKRVVLTAGGAFLLEDTFLWRRGSSISRSTLLGEGCILILRRGSTSSGVRDHIYYCWRIKEGCI